MRVSVKRLITPIVCAGTGFLTLIFMILPFSGGYSANAYGAIGDFFGISSASGGRFLLPIIAVGIILLILLAVVMLLAGGAGFLKECVGFDIFNDNKTVAFLQKLLIKVFLIAISSLVGLFVLFCVIYAIAKDRGLSYVPHVGAWFLLVLGAGEYLAHLILTKRFEEEIASGISYTYKCSSCSKKAKAREKFCSQCGSPIIAVRKEPAPEYRCSSCNLKAKASEKFCSQCGSPIIAVTPTVVDYRCSVCGISANENEKFCSQCGSPIIAVRNEPAEPTAVETEAALTCSSCGAPIEEGEKFCANCGTPTASAPAEPEVAPTCSSCGAPIEAGEKFCANCGMPTAPAEPKAERRCPSCGTVAVDNDKFCANCGTAI